MQNKRKTAGFIKHMKSFFAPLFVLIFLVGCVTASPEIKKNNTPPNPAEEKIQRADRLLKAQKFQQAFILYSEAQKEAGNIKLFKELQLKISEALCGMKNYPAALTALAPVPELPATLHDCRKLVAAARILQKMKGKPHHIEALYEVALDNSIDEPGAIGFKAYGYAELGKVYVTNKKTPRAIKCFEYAAKLYTMNGDKENAVICRNIMEYLK